MIVKALYLFRSVCVSRFVMDEEIALDWLINSIGGNFEEVSESAESFAPGLDIKNSLFELSQLNDIAKEAMEPWRISAENRIETLLAVEQFVESIKE